jgi:selenide, water dikinase
VLRQVVGALPIPQDKRILSDFTDAEDAAVYQLNETQAAVVTLDVITPLVDDPYLFGAIAASNSLSDVFAMGGKGLLSLSFLSAPKDLPAEILTEIMRGAADIALNAGAPILGGHSVEGKDLMTGLAVVGLVDPKKTFQNNKLKAGDALILTQRLGTGTLTTAVKRGVLSEDALAPVIEAMVRTNAAAVPVLHRYGIKAATDVTGFALLGHLGEMLKASSLGAIIDMEQVPVFDEARLMLEEGVKTRANQRNLDYVSGLIPVVGASDEVLLDPQTSGGLLVAVPAEHLDDIVTDLKNVGYPYTRCIGRVISDEEIRIV